MIFFDTGAGAREDVAIIRKAVERFIDRIGDRPIAVGTFGETPVLITTFEDDRSALGPKLDAAIANPHGLSVPTRGAALGGQTIRAVQPLFSAIVIVSAAPLDGMPDTSEEVLAPIIDSGAVVHVIANRAGTGPGATSPAVNAIRSLAEQTHGEFFARESHIHFELYVRIKGDVVAGSRDRDGISSFAFVRRAA